ncbi:hypothetical protein [Actinomadura rupiterrae]|uniref:hypothetical protein n=1 Tax=Actinomadura rupiterrae TaxID=559627 RepID=UPI0020A32A20|nr:hypothetical protein [Actinomadura rupiterrae]MCP2341103.1 hypothetical protein [Actinomadura rupiterrae]
MRTLVTAPRAVTRSLSGSPATRLTAPTALVEGDTTFRISTTDPDGAQVGLTRLRPGLAPVEFLTALERAYDRTDPSVAVTAAAGIEARATLYGGAAVPFGSAASARLTLGAGVHHMIDFADLLPYGRSGSLHEVDVLAAAPPGDPEEAVDGREPPPLAEVVLYDTPDGTRFRAPAELPAHAPVRFANDSGTFNEALLVPVRPDTTREHLDGFFAAIARGWFGVFPFTGTASGATAMSPGRSVVITTKLRPGRHALLTRLPDHRTGRAHALQGTADLVTVR